MSSCSMEFDHCRCPSGMNKYGYVEEFHQAAEEITDSILDGFSSKKQQSKE